MGSEEVSAGIKFYTAGDRPYGLTFGQWTVKWWQWFFITPRCVNPALDQSGKFASMNQPSEHVWFLAGKIATEDKALPQRLCTVPSSRSLLFPVINCEANLIECPGLDKDQLVEHVTADENTIRVKRCFVDDVPVYVQRVKSDPATFDLEINDDNPYGVDGGGTTIAAADGYWVFLKPLPPGEHFIFFQGSCENGRLNSGAEYRLRIQ
jgi:hypothetical protein